MVTIVVIKFMLAIIIIVNFFYYKTVRLLHFYFLTYYISRYLAETSFGTWEWSDGLYHASYCNFNFLVN